MTTLTLEGLPIDVYDEIVTYLPDKDIVQLLCSSRKISLSSELFIKRQRASWKSRGATYLAIKGDLPGLKYLHKIGVCVINENYESVMSGSLEVVKFLKSVGATYTSADLYWAAYFGCLALVEFFHNDCHISCADSLDCAAGKGHLNVVKYLHSVGAIGTTNAIDWAASNGHLSVVEFLLSLGGQYIRAIYYVNVYGQRKIIDTVERLFRENGKRCVL